MPAAIYKASVAAQAPKCRPKLRRSAQLLREELLLACIGDLLVLPCADCKKLRSSGTHWASLMYWLIVSPT
jgi:hypothetical protein